jgi:subtilase family serine protease
MHPMTNVHIDAHATSFDSNTRIFHCQSPSAQFKCYGPAQIRKAYNIRPLLNRGLDGSGQTIVIIDAFQNPTMRSDLAAFDSVFGLPAPPSFKTIAPDGLTPFDPSNPDQVGWSGEIALDVEWAHAIAPNANIVLALASSDNDADLLAVQRYVVRHSLGHVISMSFGEAEQCMVASVQTQEHAVFRRAVASGITLLSSSGDTGAAEPSCDGSTFIKAASIPASDPLVTGVGGTDLVANLKTGAYGSESVWNEPQYPLAGGGGFSSLYSRPAYQDGVSSNPQRGVPDVAMTASAAHGVVVAWGSSGSPGEYWIFDGTSVGSPIWGGIVSIADQSAGHGLGNINPTLYQLNASDYHDITTGNNDFQGIIGFAALPGWDAASGLGSPIVRSLVPDLTH